MYDEPSYVDCKVETAERKWTQILLNWINMCIAPDSDVKKLHADFLSKVVELYNDDVSFDSIDKMCSSEEVEEFLMNEYPIELSNGNYDEPKKLYILFTLLLYHCCINTKGEFTNDICEKMSKSDQVIILNLCEELSASPVTVSSVERAIKDAFDFVPKSSTTSYASSRSVTSKVSKNSRTLKCEPSAAEIRSRTIIQPSVSHGSDFSKKDIDLTKKDVFSVSTYENEMAVMRVNDEQCDSSMYHRSVPCIQGPPPRYSCEIGCTCAKCRLMNLLKESKKNKDKNMDDTPSPPPCIKDYVPSSWLGCCCVVTKWTILGGLIAGLLFGLILFWLNIEKARGNTIIDLSAEDDIDDVQNILKTAPEVLIWGWECRNSICHKIFEPKNKAIHLSYNRCTLLCMGPQIWPNPTVFKSFNRSLIALSTKNIDIYYDSIPSDIVQQYLYKEYNEFLSDLRILESLRRSSKDTLSDIRIHKTKLRIAVTNDPNPRLRLDTDESYLIILETKDAETVIRVNASSYCGARHGLETLRQLIMFDGLTGNLITLNDVVINDEPKFKYRGLMIDTARNFIPLLNLMNTIDAMAACKLNTFHWRISDATSFPLVIPDLPELSDYGAYSSSMIYSIYDVKTLSERAAQKGIRVVMEITAPGPVGRAWSWAKDTTCARREDTCNSALCNQLKMEKSNFDILQKIYEYILEMTSVEDVFHIGDSVFSLNCKILLSNRDGFLKNALERLVVANNGRAPELVLAWYHRYILRDNSWIKRGLHLHVWQEGFKNISLSNYTLIHSSKWELSCLIKNQRCSFYRTWQNLYTWRPWLDIKAISHSGGEALLWTDLVDKGNLDYHLWPRTAAVAERLWSDQPNNGTIDEEVYIRLDAQRKRMQLRNFVVQPVWPQECSTNPLPCLEVLRQDNKKTLRKQKV